MKTKQTIWATLCLVLSFAITPSVSSAETAAIDDMVEFCAASLSVVRNSEEYNRWLIRYEPNMELVNLYTAKLQILLATGGAKGSDILLVADDCVRASNEERADASEEDERT